MKNVDYFNPFEKEEKTRVLVFQIIGFLVGILIVSGIVGIVNLNLNKLQVKLKNQSILFCNQYYNYTFQTHKNIYPLIKDFMTPQLSAKYKEIILNDAEFTKAISLTGINSNYIFKNISSKSVPGGINVEVFGTIQYSKINMETDLIGNTTTLFWIKDKTGNWKIDNYSPENDVNVLKIKFVKKITKSAVK